MSDHSSIPSPPPELFTEWLSEALLQHDAKSGTVAAMVADKAAQWGADQELEACCELLDINGCPGRWIDMLRAARRLNPPSLKEQALDALGPEPRPETGPTGDTILNCGAIERHRLVRRALEALPNE